MTGVTCFWLEPTDRAEVGLRRFSNVSGTPCPLMPGKFSYHQAMLILGDAPLLSYPGRDAIPSARRGHYYELPGGAFGVPDFAWPPRDDPRWPAACTCGREFAPEDAYQDWHEALYRRADNGETVTLRDAPDGAMWDAYWMPRKGPDGRSLMVKCPGGGEWNIDSRASNCTMPDDSEHRCWVRHGEPPAITVDKNGLTCAAGAGSIQAGGYHGFLRGGVFNLWARCWG